MAILVHYGRQGMTKDQYFEAMRLLQQREATRDEQVVLVTYGDPNDVQLFVVWNSRDAWEKFLREDLPSTAGSVGIDVSNFDVYEVHDLYQPQFAQH
jgi:heme-degrading monooxygenase HmoA